MIILTELGWVYSKENKNYLKFDPKNLLKYIRFFYKIKKIEKNRILIKDSINLKIDELNLGYFNKIIRNSTQLKENITKRIILEGSYFYEDIFSWAMNIEDSEVETYRSNFIIKFYDTAMDTNIEMLFYIKDIKLKKKNNKIEISYTKKDSFIVFLILDNYFDCYEYQEKIEIWIDNENIDWKKKNKELNKLFKNIINSNNCKIITQFDICYNIGIWYENVDLTNNI